MTGTLGEREVARNRIGHRENGFLKEDEFMAKVREEVRSILSDRSKNALKAKKELRTVRKIVEKRRNVHVRSPLALIVDIIDDYIEETDEDGDKLVINNTINLGELYDDAKHDPEDPTDLERTLLTQVDLIR